MLLPCINPPQKQNMYKTQSAYNRFPKKYIKSPTSPESPPSKGSKESSLEKNYATDGFQNGVYSPLGPLSPSSKSPNVAQRNCETSIKKKVVFERPSSSVNHNPLWFPMDMSFDNGHIDLKKLSASNMQLKLLERHVKRDFHCDKKSKRKQ